MRIPTVLASVLVLGLSCNLSGPADFEHAAATLQCGPADQGWTALLLADEPISSPLTPPVPHVRVMLLASVHDLAGQEWDVTTDMGPGAWYVSKANQQAESALSGRVRVTSVDSTLRVTGHMELRFPSRSVETGFSAPWIESLALCG